jgi:hypothetical protein
VRASNGAGFRACALGGERDVEEQLVSVMPTQDLHPNGQASSR